MKALQKVAGSLLVAMLTMAGVVSFGGTAYADDLDAGVFSDCEQLQFWFTFPDEGFAPQPPAIHVWFPNAPQTGTVPGGPTAADIWPTAEPPLYDSISGGLGPTFLAVGGQAAYFYFSTYVPVGIYELRYRADYDTVDRSVDQYSPAVMEYRYGTVRFEVARRCTDTPPFTPETGEKDPVAVPDVGVVPAGTPSVRVSVLDNDELPNGVKDLQVATAPVHGTATVDFTTADWPIDYVPEAGFVGEDTFTYRVTDNLDKVSETTVVIDVLPAPADPPVVTDPPLVADPPVDTPQVSDPAPGPFRAATGIEPTTSAVSVALFAWWGIVSALALGSVFLLRRWSLS